MINEFLNDVLLVLGTIAMGLISGIVAYIGTMALMHGAHVWSGSTNYWNLPFSSPWTIALIIIVLGAYMCLFGSIYYGYKIIKDAIKDARFEKKRKQTRRAQGL